MASVGNHSLHMFLQWNRKAILRCRLYNSSSTGHIWLICRGLQALVHKPPFLQGWLSGQLAECPGCIVLFLCVWNSRFIALLRNVFGPQCLWLFSARPWDSLSAHVRLWVFQLHGLKTPLPKGTIFPQTQLWLVPGVEKPCHGHFYFLDNCTWDTFCLIGGRGIMLPQALRCNSSQEAAMLSWLSFLRLRHDGFSAAFRFPGSKQKGRRFCGRSLILCPPSTRTLRTVYLNPTTKETNNCPLSLSVGQGPLSLPVHLQLYLWVSFPVKAHPKGACSWEWAIACTALCWELNEVFSGLWIWKFLLKQNIKKNLGYELWEYGSMGKALVAKPLEKGKNKSKNNSEVVFQPPRVNYSTCILPYIINKCNWK